MIGTNLNNPTSIRIRRTLTAFADHIERRTSRQTGRKIRQLIWPGRFAHMREVSGHVSFHPSPEKGWKLHSKPTGLLSFKGLGELRGTSPGPHLIVASGPSASRFDWTRIRPEVKVFAVNGSCNAIPQSFGDIDVYVAIDPDFFEYRMNMVTEAIKRSKLCFLGYEGLSRLAIQHPEILRCHADNCVIVENINRHYARPSLSLADFRKMLTNADDLFACDVDQAPETTFTLSRIGWSANPASGIFPARTVVFAAMQLANFLGSREIALTGADFSKDGRAYREAEARPSKIAEDFDHIIKPALCLAHRLIGLEFTYFSNQTRLSELGFFRDGNKEKLNPFYLPNAPPQSDTPTSKI